MKKNGYIMLEMIISLGMISLIFLGTSAMIFNLSNLNHKIINGRDKLENVRLGQYFLSEQIRRTDKIKIITDQNSTMKSITTYILISGEYKSNHTFSFKDNALKFGGMNDNGTSFNNELSQNISDIKINYNGPKKLLHIKITTENFPPLNFVLHMKNKTAELKKI